MVMCIGDDMEKSTIRELRDIQYPLVDCPDEANHIWERLEDGSAYCVWCEAKVRRVGR